MYCMYVLLLSYCMLTCSLFYLYIFIVFFFFFFQAEDGIRDIGVTGVQTCALPIFNQPTRFEVTVCLPREPRWQSMLPWDQQITLECFLSCLHYAKPSIWRAAQKRSEERRVGKECRSRWSQYH